MIHYCPTLRERWADTEIRTGQLMPHGGKEEETHAGGKSVRKVEDSVKR